MITAIDTSIVLDILIADDHHLECSRKAFTRCQLQGRVVASPIVWSELRPVFGSSHEMETTMVSLGIDFDSLDERTALLAGEIWKNYRAKGGARDRIITDFLIGAHAMVRAERLLTRDRGFYRGYFKKLLLVDGD